MIGLITKEYKLALTDTLEMPQPSNDEVLVKVVSSTLNPTDQDIAAGHLDNFVPDDPDKPRVRTGLEFSGIVEQSNGQFAKGDKVYSYIDILDGQKTHQEYVSVVQELLAPMPESIDFDQAASVPLAAVTDLVALRDVGKLQAGERILINGAAGGLGIFAVQMAKRIYGAHVTAVAGPGQESFLTSLGADVVYNYRETPLSELDLKFDLILDVSTVLRYADISEMLTENGRFIPLDPFKNEADFAEGSESAKRTLYLFVSKGSREDLDTLTGWIESGTLVPYVDSVFKVDEIEKALERLNTRAKRGRVVIRM